MPANLPPLRDIIQTHGLQARKSLGQNFLLDLNLTGKIARAGGPLDGVTVVEVGPGPGGLTRALLDGGAGRVIAIEKDRRAIAALADLGAHYPGRLHIIEADALEVDYEALCAKLAGGGAKPRLIANLPYNIATPLLTGWLNTPAWPPWYDSMTLMFQKEVAERLTARPNTKAYGRLSILAQALCDVTCVFDVPPQAFVPAPKVTSSVVLFRPNPDAVSIPRQALQDITRSAFGQRRKMLRVSLKQIFQDTEAVLRSHGINPQDRAEDLSVEQFVALARAIKAG